MSAALAIAQRELRAHLLSPVGYLVVALFLLFTGLVYFVAAPLLVGSGFAQGQPASLRLFFEIAAWVFFLVGPAISMRTVSEEMRLGTFESLMTAPVGEGQIVLGKFAGALGFLLVMLLPTLLFVVALEIHGRPDYGEIACGYLGLVLIGAALLATGILASTLTQSQMLAYVLTVFFWLLLLVLTLVPPFVASLAEDLGGLENRRLLERGLVWLAGSADVLAAANPLARLRGFVIGLVDSFNVVYFVSFTAVFLVAATRSLGLRRCA